MLLSIQMLLMYLQKHMRLSILCTGWCWVWNSCPQRRFCWCNIAQMSFFERQSGDVSVWWAWVHKAAWSWVCSCSPRLDYFACYMCFKTRVTLMQWPWSQPWCSVVGYFLILRLVLLKLGMFVFRCSVPSKNVLHWANINLVSIKILRLI